MVKVKCFNINVFIGKEKGSREIGHVLYDVGSRLVRANGMAHCPDTDARINCEKSLPKSFLF